MSSQQKYVATQLKNKDWNWVQEEAGSVGECAVHTERGSVQVMADKSGSEKYLRYT